MPTGRTTQDIRIPMPLVVLGFQCQPSVGFSSFLSEEYRCYVMDGGSQKMVNYFFNLCRSQFFFTLHRKLYFEVDFNFKLKVIFHIKQCLKMSWQFFHFS